MDHFLSGLENHTSPWYARNPVHTSPHEFAVGTNSYHLIPISGGAGIMNPSNIPTSVARNVPATSCLNLSNSGPTTSGHYSSPANLLTLKTSTAASNVAAAVNNVAAAVSAMTRPDLQQVKEENISEDHTMHELDGFPMNFSKISPKKEKNGSKAKWDTKKACNLCGKVLSRGDKLKNHMRIHTNNFPFHCTTCGQGFLRSEGLRIHTRIHTGERPYVCIVCGKSYTRKDKLTRHAIIHTGERPFVCAQCGKSFTRKDKLQRHELIHKVEKPWTCVPCNLEFGRQEGFNAHMERKHPERLAYTLIQQPRPNNTQVSPSPEYLLAGTGLGGISSALSHPPTSNPAPNPQLQPKSPIPSTSRLENIPPISLANKSLAHLASRLPSSILHQP